MEPPPLEMSGLPVICYSPVDGRHRPTGHCRHAGPGGEIGPAKGLAVCGRPGDGFFLFSCDGSWSVIADTWHPTAEEARQQAEFEYEGVSNTWQHRG